MEIISKKLIRMKDGNNKLQLVVEIPITDKELEDIVAKETIKNIFNKNDSESAITCEKFIEEDLNNNKYGNYIEFCFHDNVEKHLDGKIHCNKCNRSFNLISDSSKVDYASLYDAVNTLLYLLHSNNSELLLKNKNEILMVADYVNNPKYGINLTNDHSNDRIKMKKILNKYLESINHSIDSIIPDDICPHHSEFVTIDNDDEAQCLICGTYFSLISNINDIDEASIYNIVESALYLLNDNEINKKYYKSTIEELIGVKCKIDTDGILNPKDYSKMKVLLRDLLLLKKI